MLNGKPFLMTLGPDEIKVLDASQSITQSSAIKQHPTQQSNDSSLDRVNASKKMLKNKAYLQPLSNMNDEAGNSKPGANNWGRADSLSQMKTYQNLSFEEST